MNRFLFITFDFIFYAMKSQNKYEKLTKNVEFNDKNGLLER